MASGANFKSLMDRLPVNNDSLIGQAVGWFVQQQNPENVEFTKYNNGYQISVRTSEMEAEEAKEFWENHVQPNLSGEQ